MSLAYRQLLSKVFQLQDDPSPRRSTVRSLPEARIAVCKTPVWTEAGPGTRRAFDAGVEILRQHGVSVEEITLPSDFASLPKWQDIILRGEGRSSFLHYAVNYQDHLKPLLVDYVQAPIEKHKRSEQLAAYDGAARLRPVFDEIASKYDALLCPSVPDEAPEGLEHTGSYVSLRVPHAGQYAYAPSPDLQCIMDSSSRACHQRTRV